MISATIFMDRAKELGFGLYSGVPSSYLKPLLNRTMEADGYRPSGRPTRGTPWPSPAPPT